MADKQQNVSLMYLAQFLYYTGQFEFIPTLNNTSYVDREIRSKLDYKID